MDNKAQLRESPVRVVWVDYLCEVCGEPMKATKFQAVIGGVQHQCGSRKCGNMVILDHEYPRIEHRRAEDGK